MVYVKNGSKYKWQEVVEMHERYPHANNADLAKLCDCDEKTVRYAQTKPEWKELDVLEQEAANLDVSDVDAVKLLFKNLLKVNSVENPDIRALNALMTFLDKTGQLAAASAGEGEQKLQKLSLEQLIQLQSESKSRKEDLEDSLYR